MAEKGGGSSDGAKKKRKRNNPNPNPNPNPHPNPHPHPNTTASNTHKFKPPHAEATPMTKRERRLHFKGIIEARKKRRNPNYTLEQELASLWEKMRRRNLPKEDKSKFVSEALRKMKGKIHEIATSPVCSRVLQTCIKNCLQEEKDAVFTELRPHFLALATDTYAVFLVKKLLDNASKSQFSELVSLLRGHVASLLRHMVGSTVVEHAYELANATQKQSLLVELYSPELQLFRDKASTKETRLEDIISKLGLQKVSVVRHMYSVFHPILEKGIVDHSIIHKALVEFLSIADKTSAAEIMRQLPADLLVRMINNREGSRIVILRLKHGSAKERKLIIKALKEHVVKMAKDQYGTLVLASIFTIVDDTKLVTKLIIHKLQKNLKELLSDKNGRRSILQLLHPTCTRYFSPDDLASFNIVIPSLCTKGDTEEILLIDVSKKSAEVGEDDKENYEAGEVTAESKISKRSSGSVDLIKGGKKDPLLRRQELLVNSGLAENLVDACIEAAGDLLRSPFGKEIVYEVATGGADGILHPALDSKLDALHEAIASVVANPKHEEEKAQEEHLLINFHSSRTIRKLVLDSPTFASTLWKNAFAGKCELWAQGHSSKVVSAFLESSDSSVREIAREQLQPLVDRGILKLPDNKCLTKAA